MSHRFLEFEDDDPMLSVVNVVDVFLVMIAVLLLIVATNPFNVFSSDDDMIVVRNPGEENMEILIREGQELTRYESTGDIGEGRGTRAGTTYRLDDGSLIYVPDEGSDDD
ncbi:DUF2149 domain-containing protein [Wenzhouxiangella sp. AB-CW3]|uniref:DUF2149 domain-containing protein n=1 Tax=Wenzhouxiangella sp. AB-CW3 TaxID=2771012 RepID=UPI00168B8024|nr:DUF2149 domain-containing protein [Wenzhouxiangella sp. AB-CW3]QOC21469.1 DUF2149 domain-containing protein [Wenzhouxiangella sp. AB-CW3]